MCKQCQYRSRDVYVATGFFVCGPDCAGDGEGGGG